MTMRRPVVLPAQLPRIPEEELSPVEEVVGRGAFSVVYKATWRRKVAVGTRGHSIQVAVKMSNRATDSGNDSNDEQLGSLSAGDVCLVSNELVRDLAVISGLPHPNILTLHGVCEPNSNNSNRSNHNKGADANKVKIVYELMSKDLARLLRESLLARVTGTSQQADQQSPRSPRMLLPTNVLLRVLRDASAGLAHLHSHGVVHRDVKPANVLLRDEQVKLCDFGSSRDLQHTIQQMSLAGTLDYMAPEVLNKEPAGRSADVWSFGVLLFECVTGKPCARKATLDELTAELTENGCLPALVQLFAECHQVDDPSKRPSMASIHSRLQKLVMQEASDSQRLKEELKRAEAQDRDTYDLTWNSCYANQQHSKQLLDYLLNQQSSQGLRVLFLFCLIC